MTETTRKCPFCAEEINAGAIVCKHCKLDVAPGICLACRRKNRLEAKYCGHCGGAELIPDPAAVERAFAEAAARELGARRREAEERERESEARARAAETRARAEAEAREREAGAVRRKAAEGAAAAAREKEAARKARLPAAGALAALLCALAVAAVVYSAWRSFGNRPKILPPESVTTPAVETPSAKPAPAPAVPESGPAAKPARAEKARQTREAAFREKIKNMTLIPAGEFLMGSPEGEGSTDEHPRHKVYLDGYYIGKYETTFEQYDKYCEATGKSKPSDSGWGRGSRPVINVSWDDAKAYCEWAGKRLPTEAEWEKASRGGPDTKYSFGNDESGLGEYAWYGANSGSQTHPVGEKKPNQYGLYDMHGNVWEWVADWYDGNYYRNSPARNPKGPDSGTLRGLRGGSWISNHGFLRAAVRSRFGPGDGGDNCDGFRCVVSARDSK